MRDEVVGRKRAKLNILEKVGEFLTRLGSRRKKEKNSRERIGRVDTTMYRERA